LEGEEENIDLNTNTNNEIIDKHEVPKFAPFPSYDNYLLENQKNLMANLEGQNTPATTSVITTKKTFISVERQTEIDEDFSNTAEIEVKIENNLDLIEDQNFSNDEKPLFVSWIVNLEACLLVSTV
jgi:hypothetical protein